LLTRDLSGFLAGRARRRHLQVSDDDRPGVAPRLVRHVPPAPDVITERPDRRKIHV